jgi:hypothetical protein
MNQLLGFGLLFVVLVLVSVSSSSYVKKASAIYFGNGPCPSGEARDYLGICFPIKECKSSLFARPGSCSVAPEAPKGGGTYTITQPKYKGSPILGGENAHSTKNNLECAYAQWLLRTPRTPQLSFWWLRPSPDTTILLLLAELPSYSLSCQATRWAESSTLQTIISDLQTSIH